MHALTSPAAGPRSSRAARLLARWRLPAVGRRELAPIAVLTVVSTVGTIAAPALRHEGMLLALLSPRLVFLGLAADQTTLVPFVLLATFRLCLADPWHYRLGRRHGSAVLHRCGRPGRWLDRLGHRPWLVLAVVAVRPIGRHLMWAGARRTHPVVVGVTDLVSTTLFCVAVKTGVDLLP